VGTRNGLLLRSHVDSSSGALSDTRSRFLGLRAVRLAAVRASSGGAVLALGERPWLLFASAQSLLTAPVACPPLQHAAPFASAADPFGWAALQGDSLKVLSVAPSAEPFHLRSIPVHSVPRRMALHVSTGLIVVASSSAHLSSPSAASEPPALEPFAAESGGASLHLVDPFAEHGAGALALSASLRGGEVTCMACAALAGGRAEYLAVGLRVAAPSSGGVARGRLLLFSLARAAQGAPRLALEQTTDTAEVPSALAACHGLLLAGMGKTVRLYDVGKKQLLKKCENREFPHQIAALTVFGTRFLAGDSREGVLWCFYEASKNAIRIFADEVTPRHVTCLTGVDYNTAAVGDKFGVVSIIRLPEEVKQRKLVALFVWLFFLTGETKR
jgi:splicing factor 3B subunit 3